MWGATLRHNEDIWNHFKIWKLLWWLLLYVSGAIYSIITFSLTHTRRALNMSYWKKSVNNEKLWIFMLVHFTYSMSHNMHTLHHIPAACWCKMHKFNFWWIEGSFMFLKKLPSELLSLKMTANVCLCFQGSARSSFRNETHFTHTPTVASFTNFPPRKHFSYWTDVCMTLCSIHTESLRE